MFDTVLVADRGVPALRVVRACTRLDVQAVAVHADDDARAPHVRAADEAVPLGGTPAQCYGDGRKVLEAARRSGADAVHPGAGPLARDPRFARDVAVAGLVWLGPPPAALERPAEPDGPGVTVLVRGDGAVLGRRARTADLDEEPAGGAAVDDVAAAYAAELGGGGLCAVDVRLNGTARAVGVLPVLAAGSSATGAVLGADLAALELHLAAGDRTPEPRDAAPHALALQVRVTEQFAGRLRRVRAPRLDGVHTDLGVVEGGRVSATSDRLIAVVTVCGTDAADCRELALRALGALEVSGVPTNLPRLRAALSGGDR